MSGWRGSGRHDLGVGVVASVGLAVGDPGRCQVSGWDIGAIAVWLLVVIIILAMRRSLR